MTVQVKNSTFQMNHFYSLWVKNFSARGRQGGVGPPSVDLGLPNISENTRAKKLKLKMPLVIVKYSPRVQKFFC